MRTRQLILLEHDVHDGIEPFLDECGRPVNGEERIAEINGEGELVTITNFPLPDRFKPDYVDLLLVVTDYPARPPAGIYLLERNNRDLIDQISRVFNVLHNGAHGAETIEGYRWVCHHYEGDRWRYNPSHVAKGDNLRKFLIAFFNHLQSDVGG